MNPRRVIPVFWIAAALWAEEPQLKLFPVHYTDPAAAVEIIRMMMPSTNGLILTAAENRIAARGSAAQLAEVEMMLRELDRAPRNIQINVEVDRRGKTSGHKAGIRPRGPIFLRDGDIHGSFEGRFSSRNTTLQENTVQMLVAMDGKSASLRVGETVPYLTWLTEYSVRHGYIREAHIEWREVGAFLAVQPEIIGNGPLIRIRLVPTLSGRKENGDRQTIEFTELATEVVGRDGAPMSIGGFTGDEEFRSRFYVGRSGGQDYSVTGITLTPHILE